MKIWIFQIGEPLHSDEGNIRPMRAMNLANTLIQYGHQVTIWSSGFYHQKKQHRAKKYTRLTISDLLEIRLIPSRGYKKNISLGRLIDHAQIAINLKKVLSSESTLPDVAFVGYPPIEFAYVAIKWFHSKNIPSMLDVKDKWPKIFVDAFPEGTRFLARILLSPYYYMGRKTMRNATAFCAMAQGYLNWISSFSNKRLSAKDCVTPLSPISQTFSDEIITEAIKWWQEKGVVNDGRIRLFFIGSISTAFDFQEIFNAACKASSSNKNWQFVICGEGERLVNLRKLFSNTTNVIFPGWIDRPQAIALANMSFAGLAPYKNTDSFIYSIPNKVIDYLSLGKPIISPLEGEVGSLIDRHNVGAIYNQCEGSTLFEILEELTDSPDIMKKISFNATNTYEKYFSGEKVYQQLVENLISLANVYYLKK